MEDLNTGGAAPDSTTNVDAGAQGSEPSSQSQTTTATPTEEFSAGWNFEDETQPEPTATEGEDDLQGMLADPNLDPARTPGLVEAIRRERAENKQHKAEVTRLNEEIQALKSSGFGIAENLIRNPTDGAIPFLTELAKNAQSSYWAIVENLAQYAPEDLISHLQAAGNLPNFQSQTAAGQLTAEDWAKIPQELRGIAKQVPANQLIEWLDKGTDESLIYNLQREARLNQLDTAQRQQHEQAWRTAGQQAEAEGTQSVEGLTDQYEKAHYAQFEKWQPFGPNDPQNQFLYRAVLEGAHATLLADKQWQQMYQDAVNKLQNAPMRRLRNEHIAADQDERDARGLAARYNTRLGQVMKAHIQKLDSIFKDARAYREQQRQSAPDRKEISGISSTASNGASNGVSALDESGNISEGYMSKLVERMKGWRG